MKYNTVLALIESKMPYNLNADNAADTSTKFFTSDNGNSLYKKFNGAFEPVANKKSPQQFIAAFNEANAWACNV